MAPDPKYDNEAREPGTRGLLVMAVTGPMEIHLTPFVHRIITARHLESLAILDPGLVVNNHITSTAFLSWCHTKLPLVYAAWKNLNRGASSAASGLQKLISISREPGKHMRN